MTRRLPVVLLTCCLLILTASVFAQSATDEPPAPDDSFIRADRLGITFINSVDVPNGEERYQRALALGAGWNRFPLYWDRVETEAGEFDWSAYDTLVNDDIAHGLRSDVILLGVPAFHRDELSIAGLNEPIFADGTDVPAPDKAINPENPWALFVHGAVARYKPGGTQSWAKSWAAGAGVRVWEVWNEPDFSQFWQGGVPAYARMLKTAYLVIHNEDPDATVMVGGLLYPTQSNWLAQVLAIFINDPFHEQFNWYMDAVAVHSYGSAWRSGWLTLYLRQTLIEFELERPMWLNESGVPVWDDYPGPTWLTDDPGARASRATQEQQAAFLIQSAAYSWAEGAEVVFFHQLYDDCGDQAAGTDFAPNDGERFGDAFGIYRNRADSVCYSQHPEPDTPRLVGSAFALLATVFGDVPFSRRGVIDERDDGIVTITFSRPTTGERVVVAWNTTLAPLELELDTHAEADGAQLVTLDSSASIRARDDVYTIDLPAALTPVQRYNGVGGTIDIGGMPVIVIEALDSTNAERLAAQTFENVPTRAPDATPVPQVFVTDEDIAELQATSPTGVAFTSLNISRLRSLPNTETSRVVGSMPPGNSASVVGKTADDGWLLIDYGDSPVWVAAFLGDVHGDLADVPVVEAEAPAAP